MHPPDRELVDQSLSGGQEAFVLLVDRYGGAISSYLRTRSIPPGEIDDLTQDVFIKAFESLDSLLDRSAFAGWLFAIARHRAIDWFRRRARDSRVRIDDEPEDPAPRPLGVLSTRERQERVRREISSLPEVFRTTLCLKHLEGYSCREIATLHGVGIGTVTKRLSRAYQMLRRRMKDPTRNER